MQIFFSSRTKRMVCGVLLSLLPMVAVSAQERTAADPGASDRIAEELLIIPDAEPGAQTEASDGPLISSWDFVRMLLILAAVVGVIYLIFYFLKKGLRRHLPENEIIRVLGSRSLAGNRALHLVELGKSVFLLGAAEGGISLISEVKDQETLDMLRLESSKARTAPQGFGQFFQSVLKSGKSGGSRLGLQGGTIDFMKQQRQRLDKL